MKKIVLLVVLLFGFLITLSSCVTKSQRGSWNEYPPVPEFFRYRVDQVSVIVDHVREENIAQQISVIAETYLGSMQNYDRKSDRTFVLDISVEQRSFMQNIEMYNSIYISCAARDEEGKVYAKENEYISSRSTIVAAAEQNTIITRILNRILSDQQKRYKDIQTYEKSKTKEK